MSVKIELNRTIRLTANLSRQRGIGVIINRVFGLNKSICLTPVYIDKKLVIRTEIKIKKLAIELIHKLYAVCQNETIPMPFAKFQLQDEPAIVFRHLPCASHYIGYDKNDQPVFYYQPKNLLPDKEYVFVVK